MKNCAVIKNGIVENTILVDDDYFFDGVSSVEYTSEDIVDIGSTYENGVFIIPPPPELMLPENSDATPSSGEIPSTVL